MAFGLTWNDGMEAMIVVSELSVIDSEVVCRLCYHGEKCISRAKE